MVVIEETLVREVELDVVIVLGVILGGRMGFVSLVDVERMLWRLRVMFSGELPKVTEPLDRLIEAVLEGLVELFTRLGVMFLREFPCAKGSRAMLNAVGLKGLASRLELMQSGVMLNDVGLAGLAGLSS